MHGGLQTLEGHAIQANPNKNLPASTLNINKELTLKGVRNTAFAHKDATLFVGVGFQIQL
jgi:hypothetical protein